MINCPICSVVNDDSARFCAECGQRLQPDPAPVATEMTVKEPEIVAPPPVQANPEVVPTQPAATQEAISAIEEAKKPSPPKPVKKLHSPLLKPDDYGDEEEPPIHSTGRKGRSLRSPILGGGEPSYEFEAEDDFASKHKGLRSPLLGGGDPEPPQHRFVGEPQPARPGHLHSPLLDSTYDEYDDFIDDFETVEDPNVLRSPLLAAKVPMHTHTHEAPAQPPAPPEEIKPPVTAQPVASTPSPSPVMPAPASMAPPASTTPPAASTAPPPPTPAPTESTSQRFPTAGVGQLPHPTKVGMSAPTGLKSSLLGSQEDDEYESSRYAPPPNYQQDEGMSSIIRMFVWPLALSACVRLWVMAEYARGGMLSPPVIAGELSHIIVIAFLILVAINYPTQKRF